MQQQLLQNGANSALPATQRMPEMSSKCCQEQVRYGFCALHSTQSFCFLFLAGEWPKNEISNRDAIRLQLACDVMGIDARQSIFYTAVNAFGEERLTTM